MGHGDMDMPGHDMPSHDMPGHDMPAMCSMNVRTNQPAIIITITITIITTIKHVNMDS